MPTVSVSVMVCAAASVVMAAVFSVPAIGVDVYKRQVHTGFSYLLYFASLPRLDRRTIATFSYIDPISAILLSSLFLAEPMTLIQAAGAVLILGATLVNELIGMRNARA